MPCAVNGLSGWPSPWPPGLTIPANTSYTGSFSICYGSGGTSFQPAVDTTTAPYPAPAPSGWEVGARPSAITITISSPDARSILFELFDVDYNAIGSLPHECPIGESVAVLVPSFGSADIGSLVITVPYGMAGLDDMFVTDISTSVVATQFWQNFHGQYEAL